MKQINTDIVELIKERISESSFKNTIESLLMKICAIDTSPALGIEKLRAAENLVFGKLSDYFEGLKNLGGNLIKHPIDKHIVDHDYYTKVFSSLDGREIPAETAYEGRYNLLYLVNSNLEKVAGVRNIGLNAHIDVVNPYFPPAKEREYIHGRGSTDDKGGIMVIVGALTILDSLLFSNTIEMPGNIAGMFVIEEEMGGNGSLSVAMDHDLQRAYYDSLLVLECASNSVYPGNRGAIFVKVEGSNTVKSDSVFADQSNLVESFASGIVNIVEEGIKIKQESYHPIFPQNPVYTCTGILGAFGKHPSGICDYIELQLHGLQPNAYSTAVEAIEKGLNRYIQKFGDKRNTIDALTGKPKISIHYKIIEEEKDVYHIGVYGSGGHMGSLPENDAAITKWAYIVQELHEWKLRECSDLNDLYICLSTEQTIDSLIFEGAQSFLPCHKLDDIQSRINNSFFRGMDDSNVDWKISFDKLRNEAFASDPNSVSMKNAVDAAVAAGNILNDKELRGWDASCDARIFAMEFPDLPVITTGPGELNGAHSDKEVLYLPDLYKSILFTVLYLLGESRPELT